MYQTFHPICVSTIMLMMSKRILTMNLRKDQLELSIEALEFYKSHPDHKQFSGRLAVIIQEMRNDMDDRFPDKELVNERGNEKDDVSVQE